MFLRLVKLFQVESLEQKQNTSVNYQAALSALDSWHYYHIQIATISSHF